jgi:hypothetical protein
LHLQRVPAACVFPDISGVDLAAAPEALETAVLSVADGSMSKPALIDWMRAKIRSRS